MKFHDRSGKSKGVFPPSILLIALTLSVLLSSCAGFSSRAPRSFNRVAERVLPSVVQVEVTTVRTQVLPEGEDFPYSPWHFGPFDPEEEVPDSRDFESQGIGSGVIIRSEEGAYYVLTNQHVVGTADGISVRLHDGRVYDGSLVGSDSRKDLALIRFETEDEGIVTARMGDSDRLEVGDWVVAIGNPYGYESTVTAGIVSAIGRRGFIGNINDFIQTDAAINQGNSGGALVNLVGEVVGINTWISTPTGGSIGLGFSIPINNAKKAIADFIDFGSIRYGWVGVSVGAVLEDMLTAMNIDENARGAFVFHVFQDSPADRSGILPGDFITAVDGSDIRDSNELVLVVGDLYALETYDFTLIREGEEITVPVTVGLRESDETISRQGERLWPGIGVYPISPELKAEIGIAPDVEGVFVGDIEPNTPFQRGGAQFGDVIVAIDSQAIQSMLHFYAIINGTGSDTLEVTCIRNGTEVRYTVIH
jgi:Do/DeqQ family serine protease